MSRAQRRRCPLPLIPYYCSARVGCSDPEVRWVGEAEGFVGPFRWVLQAVSHVLRASLVFLQRLCSLFARPIRFHQSPALLARSVPSPPTLVSNFRISEFRISEFHPSKTLFGRFIGVTHHRSAIVEAEVLAGEQVFSVGQRDLVLNPWNTTVVAPCNKARGCLICNVKSFRSWRKRKPRSPYTGGAGSVDVGRIRVFGEFYFASLALCARS